MVILDDDEKIFFSDSYFGLGFSHLFGRVRFGHDELIFDTLFLFFGFRCHYFSILSLFFSLLSFLGAMKAVRFGQLDRSCVFM